MNINPINSVANHPIKHGKGQDKFQEKVKPENDAVKSTSVKGNDVQVKMTFDHNQKLMVGAKMLLASLNKELTLDESFSYESFSKKSLSIKDGQPVALDKIEIKPFEFNFEEVAKNVMDFVSGVILGAKAGGASDEKLNELLGQARSGIDLGFSQAREDLKGFGINTPEIEEGIDISYGLIQDAMSDLEQQVFPKLNESAGLSETKTSARVDLREQEMVSISIQTLDGDSLNINFSHITSLSQQQQTNNDVLSQKIEFSETKSFSFEVEGNLDKEELKAVTSLVKEISKLADDFFSGDIEKSWQQAGALGFDDQQITQFAFDFKEVKQIAVLEHYSNGASESPIATISPYLKDLNSIVKQADSLFEGNNLKQLMHDVAEQSVKLSEGSQAPSSQNFSDFNQRLLAALDN
jgi:hypothetical protein